MKKCIVVSAKGEGSFSAEQVKKLKSCAETTFLAKKELINEEEFIEMLKGYEIAAVTRRVRKDIGADILSRLPDLRAMAVFSTGYEWIDVEYMKKNGIKLSYLPQYSTVSVAEHAVGLILVSLHRIHLGYDFSRDMLDKEISMRGFELYGKKTGIIGFGRIGQKVYSMLQPFGAEVKYYDIDEKKQKLVKGGFENIDTFFADKDIIVICASKERNANPIIGSAEISEMKSGVIIVNPARADLVDNNAVSGGIKSGRIFTYAADEKTGAFKETEKGRVIETGHTAWYSTEAVERGTGAWVENIAGLCTGNPANIVV
jgi:lactate dehydrogenase-like 2-hydroxyacid dehydrogenase